jgi:mono/diheme cytochrome c family protein
MRSPALALIAALLGCLPQTAQAGNCYQQAVKAYAAPYYVQKAQVYYYVGQNIRAAAVVEAEKANDPDYQQFQEFKKFREEWEAFKAAKSDPPQGALAQQAPQTVIQQRCVRCHSGPEAADGRDFSGPLTPEDLKAIKEVLPTGRMPKPNSPEAKGFSNELAGEVILNAIDALSAEPEELQAPPATDDPPPLPPPQEQ